MIPQTMKASWPEVRAGRFAALIERENPRGCTVGLLGVPDDTGVALNHGRVGAKGGPRAFREALAKYGVAHDQRENRDLSAVRVFDAGDLVVSDELERTHDDLSAAVSAMLALGMLPVVIGGGHDLTWPGVRALSAAVNQPFAGVYLDAHLDVRRERGSGMPFRKVLEETMCEGLTVVGLDPFANRAEHLEWFQSHGGVIATADVQPADVFGSGAMFVSIDMDVVTAAAAPGVSAVNPVGMSPGCVEKWAFAAGRDERVRYIDLMEFNPVFDEDGRTARLAARLFLSIISGVAGRSE